MEERCAGREPLRSSRRPGEFERVSQASLLLLIAVVSGPCGGRAADSSHRPRGWKAGGQAGRGRNAPDRRRCAQRSPQAFHGSGRSPLGFHLRARAAVARSGPSRKDAAVKLFALAPK
jgi:hypothetical protein